MILSGEKKTEYRELKEHWIERLIRDNEFEKPITNPTAFRYDILRNYHYNKGLFSKLKRYEILNKMLFDAKTCRFIDFDAVQFFNGGSYSEKLPNFTIELQDIIIGPGIEGWGAVSGETYFCLCLGDLISRSNC